MFCQPFYPATGPWLATASSLRGGREVSKPEVVRTEFTAYGLSFGFAVGWSRVHQHMALPGRNTIKPGHGFPKNDHRAWPPYQDRTTAICFVRSSR